METNHKELYDAPAITVLVIRTRRIICMSDPMNSDAYTLSDYDTVTEI